MTHLWTLKYYYPELIELHSHIQKCLYDNVMECAIWYWKVLQTVVHHMRRGSPQGAPHAPLRISRYPLFAASRGHEQRSLGRRWRVGGRGWQDSEQRTAADLVGGFGWRIWLENPRDWQWTGDLTTRQNRHFMTEKWITTKQHVLQQSDLNTCHVFCSPRCPNFNHLGVTKTTIKWIKLADPLETV